MRFGCLIVKTLKQVMDGYYYMSGMGSINLSVPNVPQLKFPANTTTYLLQFLSTTSDFNNILLPSNPSDEIPYGDDQSIINNFQLVVLIISAMVRVTYTISADGTTKWLRNNIYSTTSFSF